MEGPVGATHYCLYERIYFKCECYQKQFKEGWICLDRDEDILGLRNGYTQRLTVWGSRTYFDTIGT